MAHALTSQEAEELQETEIQHLEDKKQEFADEGKEFQVPDDHWSGVMSEDYRDNLPGKTLLEDETEEEVP